VTGAEWGNSTRGGERKSVDDVDDGVEDKVKVCAATEFSMTGIKLITEDNEIEQIIETTKAEAS
jgi:hypothetical protein